MNRNLLNSTYNYNQLSRNFRWQLLSNFNMGSIIKNHNKADSAIIYFDENNLKSISFGDLEEISNRFANALLVLGLTEGKACSL